MQHIVVLGAGMVGSAIAADLCRDFSVTAVDASAARLAALAGRCPAATICADLSDEAELKRIAGAADLVVGAVPGFMGYATLRRVIETETDVVDISFFDQDPFELDDLARRRGVTAVVDCGVAPGLSHMILGYHNDTMAVERFRCLVGGLPAAPVPPWRYKAPFSPIDVLEEYTRPARLRENGRIVTRPALSEPELVEMAGVGTLEAFNTDGLRTLLRTTAVPDMVEKTLRYPGHLDCVRLLADSGFLAAEPIAAGSARVRPIDVTAALLFEQWRLEPGEPELTVMEVTVSGLEEGQPAEHRYGLLDRTDAASGTSSMARTTGYTCTAVARLVLADRYARPGISAPEHVAAEAGCFRAVLADLAARGVRVSHTAGPAPGN